MFITPSFHVGEITRSHRKIVDIHVESIIVIFLSLSAPSKKKTSKKYENWV